MQVWAWAKLEAERDGRSPPPVTAAFTYELCAGPLLTDFTMKMAVIKCTRVIVVEDQGKEIGTLPSKLWTSWLCYSLVKVMMCIVHFSIARSRNDDTVQGS